jgi:hypothetical protein
MKFRSAVPFLLAGLISAGCSTNSEGKPERGPDGTIGYRIQIESNEPGARVEVNDEHVGTTPLEIKVWGDRDGTFHNFGSDDYVITVFPLRDTQSRQTKVFRTGRWFAQEDKIPARLYFDLNQRNAGGFTVEPGKPQY